MRSYLGADETSQGKVIGIGPTKTSTSIDSASATVPLYRMTRHEGGVDQLYGQVKDEKSLSWEWKYEGLACRIWEKQGPGMVPLRRLSASRPDVHCFFANEADADWWIKNRGAKVDLTVGYVYRRDGPCPEGAVPLYLLQESRLGRLLTISEGERAACSRLGARDHGIQCYVAPP
jgi:hypothetical protein